MVGPLDLAFVLDDSTSVSDDEFTDVIDFVTYVIDAFPGVSSSGTRVGIVMFSSEASIAMPFNRYFERKRMIAAVKKLQRKRGGTHIGEGLAKSFELYSSKAYGSRPSALKVMLLMTDGKNQGEGVVENAKKLRERGVRVIVVGVGKAVLDVQLEQIAGKKENVFKVDSFKGLEPVVAELIPASCPRPAR